MFVKIVGKPENQSLQRQPSVAWSSSTPGIIFCGHSALLWSILSKQPPIGKCMSSTGCGGRCHAFRSQSCLAGVTSNPRLFKRGTEKATFSFRRSLAVSSIEFCQCKFDERDVDTRLGGGCCHKVMMWQWS
jgi:hypothetical protein